jgi:predicted outer membrane repeat protein
LLTYVNTFYSGKVVIIYGRNASLDANHAGRFFFGDASEGATSLLELHETILQNGRAYAGGAICSLDGANAAIYDSTFECNHATVYGGAIYTNGADIEIHNSLFKNARARQGDFAYYGGGGAGRLILSYYLITEGGGVQEGSYYYLITEEGCR